MNSKSLSLPTAVLAALLLLPVAATADATMPVAKPLGQTSGAAAGPAPGPARTGAASTATPRAEPQGERAMDATEQMQQTTPGNDGTDQGTGVQAKKGGGGPKRPELPQQAAPVAR